MDFLRSPPDDQLDGVDICGNGHHLQDRVMTGPWRMANATKTEADMIEVFDKALQNSQRNVEKEIIDVTRLGSK